MDEVLREYPFKCTFSLELLIDYWKQSIAIHNGDRAAVLETLRKKLVTAPELLEPVEDLAKLEPHRDIIRSLMSAVFPDALWDSEALIAMIPFALTPFMVSPRYQELLLNDNGTRRGKPLLKGDSYVQARVLNAYFLILQKCYGIHDGIAYPTVEVVPDRETGLDRYLKIKPNFRFVQVLNNGGPKELTQAQRDIILSNLADPEVLREILPPENFEFRGFTVGMAIDVTESEVLTAIEADLVDSESIFSQAGFMRLQNRLKVLFNKPNLMVSLAGLRDDQVMMLNSGCEMTCTCIFAGSQHMPQEQFKGSVFHRAVENGKILLVRDLLEECNKTRVDEMLIQNGLRSMLIAPLIYQGEILGTLDLGSPIPSELGPRDALLVKKIAPRFVMALKRAMDELENNVQKVIKEKCTAVHPSVEWAFRKAVFDHMESLHKGNPEDLQAVVFRDVYPLYGASDIRGSSDARNSAIQEDLSEHLNISRNIIRLASDTKSLPILDELRHRIDRYQDKIQRGLSTGDDMGVITFLARDVEPIFPVLRQFSPNVEEAIQAYENTINTGLGTIYRKRELFEESVSRFNERLSTYLDAEEAEAQQIFPHYFNKHQTDGVDYLIYIGESMSENGGFDELYVRNLRLWQLMVACGIAWHVDNIKTELDVPLEATHLILVHHSPLSIRFRFDEKRFDVDGAYDIAHEIVRSRIDKATVNSGRERLTQPEKIAIVYSRPDEAQEMRVHIDFLQHQGFLTNEVESVILDDLPAVQGLKALRVAINLDSPALAQRAQRMMG